MRLATLLLTATLAAQTSSQPPVNASASVLADFSKRVGEYVKLHRRLAKAAPLRSTNSPDEIQLRQAALARNVRAARAQAKRGDIFTPEIGKEFRRLARLAMTKGASGTGQRVEKSLTNAEPVAIPLAVNNAYPTTVPLQSMPPTLLLNLPRLDSEVEYRIVGRTLVLFDSAANLVVDFLPEALP